MTTCPDCGSENREGAKFCDACGARMEREVAETETPVASEDDGLSLAFHEELDAVDATPDEDADVPDSTGEPESEPAGMDAGDEGLPESGEVEDAGAGEAAEAEDAGADEEEVSDDAGEAEATDTDVEPPAEEPKAGYLIFPDSTEQPIPPSQWLIGRADLAKYLSDPSKANEISRGHLTVFQEGERFFIEDGATMVQRRPSTNRTWLVRGSSRILVTGTGRNELQDEDEIDVAELVRLQFVVK